MTESIYARLGATPIINCRGVYTVLGGSRLSPRVWAAMEEANRHYAEMRDVLDAGGRAIAKLIGAEAARVTPGASSAIVLGVAACIAGQDPERQAKLPNTDGMPNRVLIQRRHRYNWDRMARLAGATLVEVGDEDGTTAEQLAGALGPDSAAVLVPVHLAGRDGTLALAETVSLAHARGVPVVGDAAFLSFPFARFGEVLGQGADLVVFSAKYFGGPNTGGFIAGRRELVDAVAQLDFAAHGPANQVAFGRAFKLDRQLVVGVVAALEEWRELDHEARLEGYERLVGRVAGHLRDVPGIEMTPLCFTMEETLEPDPINSLAIRLDPARGLTAAQVEAALRAGSPRILVHVLDDRLIVDVESVTDEEAEIAGRRLREELMKAER